MKLAAPTQVVYQIMVIILKGSQLLIYSNWEPFKNVPVFRCGFKSLIHTFTIILSTKATVYCSFLFLQSNTFHCLRHSTLGSIQSASLLPFQIYSTLPFSEITKNTKHYRTVWLLCSRGSVIVTWKGVYVLLRQELLRAGGSKCLFLLVTCNNLTVLIACTGGDKSGAYLCLISVLNKHAV